MISDARLVDLPVDYAGLRGPAEVDHYETLGAPGERLAVVGNAALGERDPELTKQRLREPVLATGADDPEALRATIELAHSVLGERCVLSPHPRTDHDSLRELMPDGWRLWDGRTFDLLQRDPPALIQSSSGVALEGLKLGIPTIELSFPKAEPNYPFLRDPPVLFASNTEQLRAGSSPRQEAPPMALAPQAAPRMVTEVGLGHGRSGGHGGRGTGRAGGRHGPASRWADLGCLVVVGRTASAPGAGRESYGDRQRLNRPSGRPLAGWKLLDGLAHRRPGPLDLLDGPLARRPSASLLLIERGIDGVGQSVGARSEVVRVRRA